MSLTEHKENQLLKFKETTAEEDTARCIRFLESFDWQLEDAILAYTSGYRIPESAPESEDDGLNEEEETQIEPETEAESESEHEPESTVIKNNSISILGYFYHYMYNIISLPINLLGSLLNYIKGLVSLRKTKTEINPHAILEETFSNTEISDLILRGEFLQVFDRTISRQKHLICITFGETQNIPHEDVKSTFLSPDIVSLLKRKYMIYGIHITTRQTIQPFEYERYQIDCFPFFEVFTMEDNRMTIRYYRQDLSDRRHFYRFLNETSEIATYEMSEGLRRRTSNRRISRLFTGFSNSEHVTNLINKQNEEFESSLRADMEKQKLMMAKQKEEDEKNAAIKLKETKILLTKQGFENIRNSSIENTYGNSTDQTLSLKIKYPGGETAIFSSSKNDPIYLLYKKIVKGNLSLKSNFHLFKCQPRVQVSSFKVLEAPDERRLTDIGIFSSQVLMVEYTSDEEE